MIAREDVSFLQRFRYLEWAALILSGSAQLMWTCAAVKFDSLIAVSFIFLGLAFIVSGVTPTTTRWQFIHLICQTAIITVASALGAHHFLYLYLYVLGAKAATLLPRTQMFIIGGLLALSHILSGQVALYASHNIHVHYRPEAAYYRLIIVEGQSWVYFIVSLIIVILLGRRLVAERKSRDAEKSMAAEVEELAVKLERARIARDIHDGLGHTLTSLKIQLEIVLKQLEDGNVASTLELLQRCQDAARSSLQEVRRAVRAEKIGDFNLRQAVTELIDQIKQQDALIFAIDLHDQGLSVVLQHQIFGMIKECLTNVRKHSCASHVEISLMQEDKVISLRVSDNGKGFEADSPNPGFGLKGLRERAETIGGTIDIVSDAGKGTVISCHFPAPAGKSEEGCLT